MNDEVEEDGLEAHIVTACLLLFVCALAGLFVLLVLAFLLSLADPLQRFYEFAGVRAGEVPASLEFAVSFLVLITGGCIFLCLPERDRGANSGEVMGPYDQVERIEREHLKSLA